MVVSTPKQSRAVSIFYEVIGRTASAAKRQANNITVDSTVVNYTFYDRLRRGMARGFEQSGVMVTVIAETLASWAVGEGFQARLMDVPADSDDPDDPVTYTNDLISRFVRALSGDLQTLAIDLYGLGDQYALVNPDGSVVFPSPDTVTVVYDPADYRRMASATITTRTKEVKYLDTYTASERRLSIERDKKFAQAQGLPEKETLVFDNLLGEIPVVHFAFNRGTNETHGHPIAEPLYPHLDRYDTLLSKMQDGAEIMGNPIPTIEGAEDTESILDLNGDADAQTEQFTDDAGALRSRPRILFDRITGLLLGKGASFAFKSPQLGFTGDIRSTLKSIWILIMELSGIPEALWGTEMGQSRATSREQARTFEARIGRHRLMLEGRGGDALLGMTPRGGLLQLIYLFLRYRGLTDNQVVVGEIGIDWPSLSIEDDAQRREWAKLIHDKGTIRDETLVGLSGLIENPREEVAAARAEAEALSDPFDRDTLENLAFDGNGDGQADEDIGAAA